MTPRLRPLGILSGHAAAAAVSAGIALPLAGGPLAFSLVQKRSAIGLPEIAPVGVVDPALQPLSAPRSPWAGFILDRPVIMGILNVTPDSFSDGGAFLDPEQAISQGERLLAEGADIIDIGGESTRPGADPVAPDQEWARIEPVVCALAGKGAALSVDTRRASVMARALASGARIVNDVTALRGDPESLAVVARTGAPVVLMHMQGEPRTMQDAPHYDDVVLEVADWLAGRIADCGAAGIAPQRIVVDPGIGFGKSATHNLALVDEIGLFHGLGCGVLLGASRKWFIGHLSRGEGAADRVPGSLAVALHGLGQGVQILRVHDVAATRQAVALALALRRSG